MRYICRSFALAVFVVLCFPPMVTAQMSVKVTDVGATAVDLHAVSVDYTDYRFGAVLISQVDEVAGVRLSRGGGQITVTWDRIKQLTVKDGEGEITPQGGTPITAKLVGDPVLRGRTELGGYQMPFARVRTIVVLGQSDYRYPEYTEVDAVVTDRTGTVTQFQRGMLAWIRSVVVATTRTFSFRFSRI